MLLFQRLFNLLFVRTQILHETAEQGGFQSGITLRGLPHGGVFVAVGVGFLHAAMGEEYIGTTFAVALEADSKFVALASGIYTAQTNAFKQAAQAVLRQFGAVFRPIGFHQADTRLFTGNHEALLLPESMQERPHFSRVFVGNVQPTLTTFSLHGDVFHLSQHRRTRFIGSSLLAAGNIAGSHRSAGWQVIYIALRRVV